MFLKLFWLLKALDFLFFYYCVCACHTLSLWAENNFVKLVFSFHLHVGLGIGFMFGFAQLVFLPTEPLHDPS